MSFYCKETGLSLRERARSSTICRGCHTVVLTLEGSNRCLCFRGLAGHQKAGRERERMEKKARSEQWQVKKLPGVELCLTVPTPPRPTESGTSQRPLLLIPQHVGSNRQVRTLAWYFPPTSEPKLFSDEFLCRHVRRKPLSSGGEGRTSRAREEGGYEASPWRPCQHLILWPQCTSRPVARQCITGTSQGTIYFTVLRKAKRFTVLQDWRKVFWLRKSVKRLILKMGPLNRFWFVKKHLSSQETSTVGGITGIFSPISSAFTWWTSKFNNDDPTACLHAKVDHQSNS